MADEKFELVSSYQPTGDQPQAIETLVKGVERGDRCQTLLGVTGSGKTQEPEGTLCGSGRHPAAFYAGEHLPQR